jgi:hypothetical protein
MGSTRSARRARAGWRRGAVATIAAAIGAVLALGVAPAAIATAPAAGAATTPPPGSEGLVVDAWRGLHIVSYAATATIRNTNHASYWPGWDIARGVALRAADPMTCASFGGYTLDAWGGLHPFGINGKTGPSKPKDGPYWRGWDIARDVALVPTDPRDPDSPPAGGYVLDGFGGLHYFTIDGTVPQPTITGNPYWNGWDIARGLIILTGPGGYNGGFVVDAWGALHPFSIGQHGGTVKSPPAVDKTTAPYWRGWQIVQGGAGLPGSNVNGGLVLDAWGGLHPFKLGSGPVPTTSQLHGAPYWKGWDVARGMVMKPKKACP